TRPARIPNKPGPPYVFPVGPPTATTPVCGVANVEVGAGPGGLRQRPALAKGPQGEGGAQAGQSVWSCLAVSVQSSRALWAGRAELGRRVPLQYEQVKIAKDRVDAAGGGILLQRVDQNIVRGAEVAVQSHVHLGQPQSCLDTAGAHGCGCAVERGSALYVTA